MTGASRLLMLLFVPLSLATYSTFPLLMLAICLIRRDRQKSILDLLGLVLLFGTALGLGLLVIYSGNYLAHGVFGLELADWREPSKARSLAGYVENLRLVPTYFALFFEMMGFGRSGTSWVNLSLFAVSLGLVSRHRPMDALYIGAGVAAGLGLLMLHTVQEGVIIPFRSTHFLWLLFAVTLFRAATVLGRNSSRTASLALVVSFSVVLTSTLHVRNYYQSFQKWQAETRTIASQIPFDDGKIYVQGSYLTVPGAHEAEIFHERAIAFRLHSLSGMGVILCSENPRTCQDKQIPTSFETPASGWTVLTEGTESYLLIEPSEQEQ